MNNNSTMEETVSEYGNRGKNKGWQYLVRIQFSKEEKGGSGEREKEAEREKRGTKDHVNPDSRCAYYTFSGYFYTLIFLFHDKKNFMKTYC